MKDSLYIIRFNIFIRNKTTNVPLKIKDSAKAVLDHLFLLEIDSKVKASITQDYKMIIG